MYIITLPIYIVGWVTIVIVSVTITTVIVKNYYHDSGHVVTACAFDIVLPRHTHNHMEKNVKMARNISDEIDLDKELKVFLLERSKCGVWEYLVSLPQVENVQNLYPNFSFTIVIVFTVSIKYRDS